MTDEHAVGRSAPAPREDGAPFDFYRAPGAMTELPDHPSLSDLPTGLDALRETVQGLLLHRDWAHAYGVEQDSVRTKEQNLRSTAEVLHRAFEISAQPVSLPRHPSNRVISICRHFALLHTAFLRSQGVPARVRCGFSSYFDSTKWYDHWITERWDGERWVRDDPQIDDLQAKALNLGFDPHDQPPGRFLAGSEAWIAARGGDVDTEVFGITDMWGLGFIASNVISDFACLNKLELLPWDSWGMMTDPRRPPSKKNIAVLDEVAALSNSDHLDRIRSRFSDDVRLRVPPNIVSYTDSQAIKVHLDI